MADNMIKHILCALLGRPESRDTVTYAIDLALENDARLTFIHINDAQFMVHATPTLSSLKVIYQQLYEMGEFMMLILIDRATRKGVSHVDYIVRQGKTPEQLRKIVRETQADVLILGRPVGRPSTDVFKPKEFERFIHDLEKETGIKVIPVSPPSAKNEGSS
jgi:nucleotide-binding universal stress UspA family protein